MRNLTDEEWRSTGEASLRRVFRNTDPSAGFDAPVADEMQSKALLYPCGCGLRKDEISAVIEAAEAVGETRAYMTLTEVTDPIGDSTFTQSPHIELDLSEYWEVAGRRGVNRTLENALYSVNGTWGILVSHEDHAVVGGDRRFVSVLLEEWPHGSQMEQVERFVNDWQAFHRERDASIDWLEPLLTHLFGEEEAKSLLDGGGYQSLGVCD